MPNIIQNDKSIPVNCKFIDKLSESMKKIDFAKSKMSKIVSTSRFRERNARVDKS